jgi:hypothetical protein
VRGCCDDRKCSPDFIVRSDKANRELHGSVDRHSYLYWLPKFTLNSSRTVDVSVVRSAFRPVARLLYLAVRVPTAAYLSVLRDNTVLSVFRGTVSVHQDGVPVCTSPNRLQTCSQCSLSQMINLT